MCEGSVGLSAELTAWIKDNAALLVDVQEGKVVEVHCNFKRNQVMVDVIKLVSKKQQNQHLLLDIHYKRVQVTLPQRYIRQRVFDGQFIVPALSLQTNIKDGYEVEWSPPFMMGAFDNMTMVKCAKSYRIHMIPRDLNADELLQVVSFISEFVNKLTI